MKILNDLNSKGKRRNWKQRKAESLKIADAFYSLGEKKRSYKIRSCASCLTFKECTKSNSHRKKLVDAHFCHQRLCPLCAWLKSRLTAFQLGQVMTAAKVAYPTYRFLMLTLTVPNVSGDDFKKTITHLLESFARLRKRTEIKRVFKGYYRTLEVTYNFKKKTYHPHFHVLLFVPPIYFSDYYISRDRYLELWREATRQPEITQVDIRKINPKRKTALELLNEKNSSGDLTDSHEFSVVPELAKYLTKFSNFVGKVDQSELKDIVNILHRGLFKRRLSQYGGILKKIHRDLDLVDVDDATDKDLIGATEESSATCDDCGAFTEEINYIWTRGNYYGGDFEVVLLSPS